MEIVALAFFPYPHQVDGERRLGFTFSAPEQCRRCDRQCERNKSLELKLCSYGVNYVWLDRRSLVFGFLLPPTTSAAHKKAVRHNPKNVVNALELARVVDTYRGLNKSFENEIEARKAAVIAEYRAEKGFEKDLLELLQPEMRKSFSYLHDYKQFIARVRQNINVVLESRYPGLPLEQTLDKALPSEKAIYWSAILMEEKLQAAFLLLNPDRMAGLEERVFRLHGLVIKYIRIYQSSFDEKNVRLKVVGESRGELKGNPIAAAVIPHTFIDNALKYSPRGSEVELEFRESEASVELLVSSYGPEIRKDEREKIFGIFFRADAAVRQEEEGAGFGLYLAQFAARSMGTRINVEQARKKNAFCTTFSISFARER